MTPGDIVTHSLYTNLVGSVIDINKFGVLVRWASQSRAMQHMCAQPKRHPAQFIVLAEQWKSVRKTTEGLNCMDEDKETAEQSELDESRLVVETEAELPEIVEEPVEAIEESVDSDPLPAESEYEELEEEES
jgi:hypothetical protein